MANRSDQINELAAALSKAQAKIKGALKDSQNPYFSSRYADLASVWDACREALSSNGLAVSQLLEAGDSADSTESGKTYLETVLMHSSGQFLSGRQVIKPVKDDPQGMGSAITYARRYGLAAIVGVAPEDDDANLASGKPALGTKKAGEEIARAKLDGEIALEGEVVLKGKLTEVSGVKKTSIGSWYVQAKIAGAEVTIFDREIIKLAATLEGSIVQATVSVKAKDGKTYRDVKVLGSAPEEDVPF